MKDDKKQIKIPEKYHHVVKDLVFAVDASREAMRIAAQYTSVANKSLWKTIFDLMDLEEGQGYDLDEKEMILTRVTSK